MNLSLPSFLLDAIYCVHVSAATPFLTKYNKFSIWLNGKIMPLILHYSWYMMKRYISSLDGHQTSFLLLLFTMIRSVSTYASLCFMQTKDEFLPKLESCYDHLKYKKWHIYCHAYDFVLQRLSQKHSKH